MSLKNSLLSLIVLAALSFAGCKSDTPKATAEKFLNDFYHMDYDGAKTVSTDETKSMLEMLSQFSAMMPDSARTAAKKTTITIKEEKMLTDSTAEITYITSESAQEQKLNLVKRNTKEKGKEEKKWLVQWDKNSGGDTNEQSSEEPATDTTTGGTESPVPTDTSAAK